LQPLAIHQLTSPLDAGDAGNAGSPQNNNGSSVVFNELLSAARTAADDRRARDDATAERLAIAEAESSKQDKDAENAIAALAAAAEFAARNVRSKQRATLEETNLVAAARRAAAQRASAQEAARTAEPQAEKQPVDITNRKTSVKTLADQTDLAQGTVIAASNDATIKTNPENSDTEDADKALPEGAPASIDPNLGAKRAGDTAHITAPSLIENTDGPETDATRGAPLQTETADPLASAPTGSPVAELATTKDPHEAQTAQDTALITPSEPIAVSTIPATRGKSSTDAEKGLAQTQSTPDLQPDLTESSTKNEDDTNTQAPQGQKAKSTDEQNINNTAVSGLMTPNAYTSSNDAQAEADPVLSHARASKQVEINVQNSQNTRREPSGQSLANNGLTRPTSSPGEAQGALPNLRLEASATSDVTTFQPDETSVDTQSNISLTVMSDQLVNSDDAGGSVPKQLNDQGLAAALKAKATNSPNQSTPENVQSRGGVELRELTKLGVKESSFSVATKPTTATSTQEPPITPPTPVATPTTQPQTTAVSTANAGMNSDRRTIAADIRLRALERMVVTAARAGNDTLTLQLYPPALGQVMIRLVMDGQRLRILTRAANAEAVNTLKGMEGDIRDALASHGLDLADFDVTDEQQDDDPSQRQKSAPPPIKSTVGANNETFTVDLNA